MTRIETIFQRFKDRNPNPQTELHYTNNFTLLIAVLLSARMTDRGVNKVTKDLFVHVHSPQDILDMGLDALLDTLKTIGLYKTKAKHIIQLCQILLDKHNGQIPTTREELEKLPGVGRKTANVVLNVAFHAPTMPVDTHVFRVSHRLGLSIGKTPEAVEKDLMDSIPEVYLPDAHHWLILHGRYICTARNPKCALCFQNDICPYYNALSQPVILA